MIKIEGFLMSNSCDRKGYGTRKGYGGQYSKIEGARNIILYGQCKRLYATIIKSTLTYSNILYGSK